MKKIIVVRPHDTWIAVKLTNWCAQVAEGEATLKVSKPGCPTEVRTCEPSPCAPCSPCALPVWTTTIVEPPAVTLPTAGHSCNGFEFQLTEEFRALGTGRFNAQITACGSTADFGIQVVDMLQVADTHVGYEFDTVPFVVDGETQGEVATFGRCTIPTGWIAVRDANNTLVGYGRAMKSMGFCKEYHLTNCSGRVVYLK